MTKKKAVFSCLLLFLTLFLCSCREAEMAQESEQTSDGQETDTGEVFKESYLTGEAVPEKAGRQRPVAVMLSNSREACPQSGIGDASVIYEAPVEGRITRLMGIFENFDAAEKVGSVRSSRDYFVYCAMEFDAIYVHFGQATPYVGDLINSDKVDNISGAVAGIRRPAEEAFYRTADRKAPHNVYVSGDSVGREIERFGYRVTYNEDHKTKFAFAPKGQRAEYEEEKDAMALYPGGTAKNLKNGYSKVQAYFEYDPETGKYYRYQYGEPQIDELDGEPVAVDNVIFQYVGGEVRDKNDYLIFSLHGGYTPGDERRVQVFTAGKQIEGTWSRYADEDPAIYRNQDGEVIELNRGKTWICLIWDDYADDVIILEKLQTKEKNA